MQGRCDGRRDRSNGRAPRKSVSRHGGFCTAATFPAALRETLPKIGHVAESSAGVGATRVDRLPATALLDGIQLAFIVAACFSSTAIVASLFRVRRDATAETIGPSAGSELSVAGVQGQDERLWRR